MLTTTESVALSTAKHNLLTNLSKFMGKSQKSCLADNLRGEERVYFAEMLNALTKRIKGMPVSYQTDGQGNNAIAHLHYFSAGSDWYITEKDMDGDTPQAFGLAKLYSMEDAELGYISIEELIQNEVELDLHWKPITIGEVKNGKG